MIEYFGTKQTFQRDIINCVVSRRLDDFFKELVDKIIKNTYKILSRGQKGCFIYCKDKELAKHIARLTKGEVI